MTGAEVLDEEQSSHQECEGEGAMVEAAGAFAGGRGEPPAVRGVRGEGDRRPEAGWSGFAMLPMKSTRGSGPGASMRLRRAPGGTRLHRRIRRRHSRRRAGLAYAHGRRRATRRGKRGHGLRGRVHLRHGGGRPGAGEGNHRGRSETPGFAADAGRTDADHPLGRRPHPPNPGAPSPWARASCITRRPPPRTKRCCISAPSRRGTATSTSRGSRSFASASRPGSRPRTGSTWSGSR